MRRPAPGFLIRVSAFPLKELTEIVRQPLLVLALVLGPFLILLLFGATLRDQPPVVRAVFVAPEGSSVAQRMRTFVQRQPLGSELVIADVTADEGAALERLRAGDVSIVVTVPGSALEAIRAGEQARVTVYHNRLDPIETEAIGVFTLGLVDEVNQQLLVGLIGQVQRRSGPLGAQVSTTLEQVTDLREALEQAGRQTPEAQILAEPLRRVDALEMQLRTVTEALDLFGGVEPEIIVSPFDGRAVQIGAGDLRLADFYAPAAVALLLQHLVVTFVSLSIVREEELGTTELFRVAPLSTFEALLGKYLSYLMVGASVGAIVLILLVALLGVPMVGSWPLLALAVSALLFASVGLGFLIALLSSSDSQAVQYAMIVLLASIFFSGFLLTLDRFGPPLPALARLLPVTYGIELLRNVMLRGQTPDLAWLLGLAGMGALLFAVSWALLGRGLRRG